MRFSLCLQGACKTFPVTTAKGTWCLQEKKDGFLRKEWKKTCGGELFLLNLKDWVGFQKAEMRGIHSGWRNSKSKPIGVQNLRVCSGTWPTVWFDWSTWESIEMFAVSTHVSFNLQVCCLPLLQAEGSRETKTFWFWELCRPEHGGTERLKKLVWEL